MDRIKRKGWGTFNGEVIACRRCSRLVEWREKVAQEKRRAFVDWEYWGKSVPGFGDKEARLVIIGLAPAAHGANRTGRMFTGDGSAKTLIAAMYRAGFANQPTSSHSEDGLKLSDAYLTAVARCAPPGNRPTAQELTNCRHFLVGEMQLLDSAQVVLALGRIAFDSYLRLLRDQGITTSDLTFSHGAWYTLRSPLPALAISYHPSRQNTQTGRLTDDMLDRVFNRIRQFLNKD